MSSPLDKTQTRADERAEQARLDSLIEQLDPPFPYRVMQFDPSFFEVPANPPDNV